MPSFGKPPSGRHTPFAESSSEAWGLGTNRSKTLQSDSPVSGLSRETKGITLNSATPLTTGIASFPSPLKPLPTSDWKREVSVVTAAPSRVVVPPGSATSLHSYGTNDMIGEVFRDGNGATSRQSVGEVFLNSLRRPMAPMNVSSHTESFSSSSPSSSSFIAAPLSQRVTSPSFGLRPLSLPANPYDQAERRLLEASKAQFKKTVVNGQDPSSLMTGATHAAVISNSYANANASMSGDLSGSFPSALVRALNPAETGPIALPTPSAYMPSSFQSNGEEGKSESGPDPASAIPADSSTHVEKLLIQMQKEIEALRKERDAAGVNANMKAAEMQQLKEDFELMRRGYESELNDAKIQRQSQSQPVAVTPKNVRRTQEAEVQVTDSLEKRNGVADEIIQQKEMLQDLYQKYELLRQAELLRVSTVSVSPLNDDTPHKNKTPSVAEHGEREKERDSEQPSISAPPAPVAPSQMKMKHRAVEATQSKEEPNLVAREKWHLEQKKEEVEEEQGLHSTSYFSPTSSPFSVANSQSSPIQSAAMSVESPRTPYQLMDVQEEEEISLSDLKMQLKSKMKSKLTVLQRLEDRRRNDETPLVRSENEKEKEREKHVESQSRDVSHFEPSSARVEADQSGKKRKVSDSLKASTPHFELETEEHSRTVPFTVGNDSGEIPSPPVISGCVVRCMDAHHSTDDGVLSLEVGDLISVMETDSTGWCIGQASDGSIGIFPWKAVVHIKGDIPGVLGEKEMEMKMEKETDRGAKVVQTAVPVQENRDPRKEVKDAENALEVVSKPKTASKPLGKGKGQGKKEQGHLQSEKSNPHRQSAPPTGVELEVPIEEKETSGATMATDAERGHLAPVSALAPLSVEVPEDSTALSGTTSVLDASGRGSGGPLSGGSERGYSFLTEGSIMVALAAYAGDSPGDLSFQATEPLTVLEEDASGWWTCRRRDGVVGLVPKTYLRAASETELQALGLRPVHVENLLKQGAIFRKHNLHGKPVERFITLSQDLQYLQWFPVEDHTKMSGKVSVSDIFGVRTGLSSAALKRSGLTGAKIKLCFTVYCSNDVLLSLEAASPEQCEEWVSSLRYLIS